MELTETQTMILGDWHSTKIQLDAIKLKEAELRKEVIKLFSATSEDTPGTETFALGAGFKLKISKSLDYKLDNKDGKLDAILETIEPAVAELLVKWKPELDVKNYKALSEDIQVKLYDVLEIKPASPQVKLEPPKV